MPPSIDLSIPSSPASDTDTIPPSTPSVDTSPAPPSSTTTTTFSHREKEEEKEKEQEEVQGCSGKATAKEEERPQVLCISRNKHWRYISSYHGPWLQLPLELLDLSCPGPFILPRPLSPNGNSNNNTLRLPPPTPNRLHPTCRSCPPLPTTQARQSNPASNRPRGGGGGRSVAMSAMRIHRLRALAVQKLAQAYKLDEIASSVMVMQGGSVFDDLAERVLKVDPGDPDAKYVHFFHEKIPSRQLAESTSTSVLDDLILRYPQRLEYFRTRGIVHCFRDEYASATRDFTHAIKEARAARRHRVMLSDREKERHDAPTRRKRKGGKTNGQAPPDGTAALNDEDDPLQLHPSVLPDAPDPIEPQFYRSSLCAIREQVNGLIKKSLRDHENQSVSPATFTTYHPLLVESHYSILLCYLLLADFRTLLERFKHAAGIVDGLEGYPFVEVLERLAGGWGEGVRPHSLSGAGGGARGKGRRPCCSSSSSSSTKPLRADAADALDCGAHVSDGGMGVNGNMNGFMGGGAGGKLKPAPINIPLHGPRVEVILAWLGGVHLPEVEGCV
ncbi:hypothetical protein BDQ17DRAFT_1345931 [Cyathus striatus]|nr:hypothetical protein BDQ17DRAFT_1345931 [Cyathus striatus]